MQPTGSSTQTAEYTLPFEAAPVVEIVREAARLAMEWRGRFVAEFKGDNTLVTEADRQIEAFLHEQLQALAPQFAFLGEETGLTGDPDAPCWVIDPIDGTTNFVRDLPLWCISVGLVYRRRVIFGVIAVPPQQEIYWAMAGQSAYLERGGEVFELHVPDRDVLIQEELIGCNTSVEEAVDFRGVPCRARNLGSLAYHLAALSRNTLCASMALYHKIYDVAAGVCICEAAGCVVRYLDGREWSADVVGGKALTPMIVAPPGAMRILLERVAIREN